MTGTCHRCSSVFTIPPAGDLYCPTCRTALSHLTRRTRRPDPSRENTFTVLILRPGQPPDIEWYPTESEALEAGETAAGEGQVFVCGLLRQSP